MTPEPSPLSAAKLRLTAGDRRSQLLAAAIQIFAEQGFHGTPTRELAKRAGVSEALVFHHFPTKDALIRAIFDLIGFEDRIIELEKRFKNMPPRQSLLEIATQFLTTQREDPGLIRVVFTGLIETPHLASEFYQKFLSRLLALETRLFERAYAERRARGAVAASGKRTAGTRAPRSGKRASARGRAHPDASVVARSFHGSLLFYNLAGPIIGMEPVPEDAAGRAKAIVDIYLPEDQP